MTAVAARSVVPRPFGGVGDQLPAAAAHLHLTAPGVRSERPAFELHHPQMVRRLRTEAHPRRGWEPLQADGSGPHLAIGTTSNDPDETST